MAEGKKTQAEAVAEVATSYEVTAKVKKVEIFKDDHRRVIIHLDCDKFASIDGEENEIEVNHFSIGTRKATEQLAQFIPTLQLAQALLLGSTINPQLLSLMLVNAKLTIKRELHEKGELKESDTYQFEEGAKYEQKTYTTDIIKCEANISPDFMPIVNAMIANPTTLKAVNVTTTTTTASPYAALTF